jgi:hypothetical protein
MFLKTLSWKNLKNVAKHKNSKWRLNPRYRRNKALYNCSSKNILILQDSWNIGIKIEDSEN